MLMVFEEGAKSDETAMLTVAGEVTGVGGGGVTSGAVLTVEFSTIPVKTFLLGSTWFVLISDPFLIDGEFGVPTEDVVVVAGVVVEGDGERPVAAELLAVVVVLDVVVVALVVEVVVVVVVVVVVNSDVVLTTRDGTVARRWP